MKKFLLKFFITVAILIFLPIIYLSTIGIETESFNKQIKNKISESNKNLRLDLKKIKLKLDPFSLKFNAKTVGATVYYYNKPLELEYIETEVSLASIIKNKFVSSNLEIGSKSLPIGDLIKFARAAYKGPELFILEKIIKKGHVILDLKINYDENGKIKDDYEVKGIIKNGKIQIFNNYIFEKINFIFNLKKREFKFQEIKFATNKINFFSKKIDVNHEEDIFYVDGIIENKNSILSNNFLKVVNLTLKNLNFDNTIFSSINNFSFELNKNFKFKNIFLKSDIDLDHLKYKRESYILDYFPKVNEEIVLKNHKLKLEYSKNLLSINGEGEIKLEENFNKINYILKNNDKNLNIQSNITLDAINLKKQDFIDVFFPSANENINFKNQKLNIKYNNKKLSLSGEGKIKIDDELESVSPSMEEASQTLRASRWQVFKTVTLPLMRPGIANAFLLGFIESLADFGNPLVLGAEYDVLSTEIFFAIVGAQYDETKAAILAMILLSVVLVVFYLQNQWLGKKSYISISGKGDSGVHPELPKKAKWMIYSAVLPWASITFVIYVMIMFGGFVEMWGVDHSFTLKHYIEAFSVDWVKERGLLWTGTAWNSFNTTFTIAIISAFPTAAIGILTAYLLTRHKFRGKNAFEFGTMLSFAIPGSVIGVSYVFAFNVPPLELTGTGIILVIAFVFRNMPVGVRAGIAAMNQLDPHLDEASSTLNASSSQTFRNIILPLLKPAITASLVFSFVRAMTAISAVIFLVSANYDLAVSYILGRLENNDYGLAIVYSSALIVVMLITITLMQLIIGKRKLGRRDQAAGILQGNLG